MCIRDRLKINLLELLKLPNERIKAIIEAANATIKPIKKEFKISSNGMLPLIFCKDQAMSCANGKIKVMRKIQLQKRAIDRFNVLSGLIKL